MWRNSDSNELFDDGGDLPTINGTLRTSRTALLDIFLVMIVSLESRHLGQNGSRMTWEILDRLTDLLASGYTSKNT